MNLRDFYPIGTHRMGSDRQVALWNAIAEWATGNDEAKGAAALRIGEMIADHAERAALHGAAVGAGLRERLRALEDEMLEHALRARGGCVAEAAATLKIRPRTLSALIKRHGLRGLARELRGESVSRRPCPSCRLVQQGHPARPGLPASDVYCESCHRDMEERVKQEARDTASATTMARFHAHVCPVCLKTVPCYMQCPILATDEYPQRGYGRKCAVCHDRGDVEGECG